MYPERFKFELYSGGTRIWLQSNLDPLSFFNECYLKIVQPLNELGHELTLEINYNKTVWLNNVTKESLIAFGAILNKIENEDQLLQDVPEL